MSMFFGGCPLCWDKEDFCTCTPEQLKEYDLYKHLSIISPEPQFKYLVPKQPAYFVEEGDIVGIFNKLTQEMEHEFYVQTITEDNKIMGFFVDRRNDGSMEEYLYKNFDKVCSSLVGNN